MIIKLRNLIKEKTLHGSKAGEYSDRRENISQKTFEKLGGQEFSIAYNRFIENDTSDKLYRVSYQRAKSDYELITPTKQERSSKDEKNIYTVWLSNLPSWRGWPRRSFSLIFFVGEPSGGASIYGDTTYLVLPKNGAKIAVSEVTDVLNVGVFKFLCQVFEKSLSVGEFIEILYQMVRMSYRDYLYGDYNLSKQKTISKIGKMIDGAFNCRYDDYKDSIKLLNTAINKNTTNRILQNFKKSTSPEYIDNSRFMKNLTIIRNLLDTFGDWENILNFLFNPHDNGFHLMTSEDIKNTNKHNDPVEAWVEDVCLLKRSGNYD